MNGASRERTLLHEQFLNRNLQFQVIEADTMIGAFEVLGRVGSALGTEKNSLLTFELSPFQTSSNILPFPPFLQTATNSDGFRQYAIISVVNDSQPSENIFGYHHSNIILGGQGNDTLTGRHYDDVLYGGQGKDYLKGHSGHDYLFGAQNNDLLIGGKGNDFLFGGQGDDRLVGGDGDDHLWGGSENDMLYGRRGRDSIDGGTGNDTLIGGREQDTAVGGLGHDVIRGDQGDDSLVGQQGQDTIFAGPGSDYLDGGPDADRLLGQKGRDRILGGEGNDTIYGHADNDTIDGNQGRDRIHGGSGDDLILGSEGDDVLQGSKGQDSLSGGDGNDTLTGNEGDDLLISQDWSAFSYVSKSPEFLAEKLIALKTESKDVATASNLLFQSGFETGSVAVRRGGRAVDIRGADQTLTSANDWDRDLDGFWLNYVDYDQGGQNPEMLGADIVSDPDNKKNKVFHAWQKDAERQDNGPYSRVQGELHNFNRSEVYYKIRFRLGSEIASVNPYSKSDASLSLIEFVTGRGNKHKLVRLILHKWGDNRSFANGQSPLQWRAEVLNWNEKRGHELFKPSKATVNYDQWQTLEFYVKSGDAETGRFWVRLNESQVIFDEAVETKAPGSKYDIEHVSLLKSYGGELIKQVKQNGGQVDVWYDDLEIWDGFPPAVAAELGAENQTGKLTQEAQLLEQYRALKTYATDLQRQQSEISSRDVLFGDEGADILISGEGGDRLSGGADDDILLAGGGNDTLLSGSGNDILIGGEGDDHLTGMDGTNILVGGAGQDTLLGGEGADIFVLEGDFELDQLVHFERGLDKIDVSSQAASLAALDSDSNGLIDRHDRWASLKNNHLHLEFNGESDVLVVQDVSSLLVSDLIF